MSNVLCLSSVMRIMKTVTHMQQKKLLQQLLYYTRLQKHFPIRFAVGWI